MNSLIKLSLITSFLVIFCFTSNYGQTSLAESSIWYAKYLNNWFPEKIPILSTLIYTTRIRCSNVDITHFDASAYKLNSSIGTSFQIEGKLKIDALPTGLDVFNGVKGEVYMLLLQGFLISTNGKIVWTQEGFPVGNAWIPKKGGTVYFTLINSYEGSLDGLTAVVIAAGDPIDISGTSETRVILGIKTFNFGSSEKVLFTKSKSNIKNNNESETVNNITNYGNLQYVTKEFNGWKYYEVVSIPISDRKKIYYELVKYQDQTGEDLAAFVNVGKRYGIPEKAMKAIGMEGSLKLWPMPGE
jgi:hypothetical protein